MSRQFYILRSGKKEGPLLEEEVLDSLDLGDVLPDDECIDCANGRVRLVRDVFQVLGSGPAASTSAARRPDEAGFPRPPRSPDPAAPPLRERVSGPSAPPRAGTTPARKKPQAPPPFPVLPAACLYSGHPSLLTYWRSVLLGAGSAIGGYYGSTYTGYIGLGGWLLTSLVLIYILIDRASRDYIVTPLRVEVVEGILSKSSREVRIEDIRAINVRTHGLTGLLGIGTVEFASAGTDAVDVTFTQVSRAHRVKKLVRRLQDQSRNAQAP